MRKKIRILSLLLNYKGKKEFTFRILSILIYNRRYLILININLLYLNIP